MGAVVSRFTGLSSRGGQHQPLCDEACLDQHNERALPSRFESDFVEQMFRALGSRAIAFPVKAANVSILSLPSEFFEHIRNGILGAKSRVVLASLYLGTGSHEKELVEALHRFCEMNPHGHVTLLLDCMRGTRGTYSDSPSSVSMLQPLLQKFPDQVGFSLYHTPMHPLFKLTLNEKYNETIGVQHIKAYVFDDDVIMSGANLSDWYFVDRQDRYMMIRDSKHLACFYQNLVDKVSSFSFGVSPDGRIALPDKLRSLSPVHNMTRFRQYVHDQISSFVEVHSLYNMLHGSDAEDNFQDCNELDTWVFPTVQMGPFDIVQDEEITCQILQDASKTKEAKLFLSSAYFNFTQEYEDIILDTETDVDIITASPQANGFFSARGSMRHIPTLYSKIEEDFYAQITARRKKALIRVHEYQQPNWTFHSKGLWLYAPGDDVPCLTMIGSPNFGRRSVKRDLESQVVLLTQNKQLMLRIKEEQQRLFTDTVIVDEETFNTPDRRPGIILTLMTKCLQSLL